MHGAAAASARSAPSSSAALARRATAADAANAAPTQTTPSPRRVVSCLVKLGGALITDKSRDETLRADALRETARHLAIAYRQSLDGENGGNGGGLVVVHGAGSFGHPTARRYGVARGGDLRADPFLREGLCATRLRVSRLHAHVLEALIDAGVPAVGLPPFAAPWGPSDGPGFVSPAHSADACARVADCVRCGLVPVLYGDCVLDSAQGCAILGGDAIMRELARSLQPERAVFLTDVDGVFDRPPEEPGARLVRTARLGGGSGGGDEWVLEEEEEGDEATQGAGGGGAVAVRIGGSRPGADDTTGGMGAKVEEAAAISRDAGGAAVVVARGGTEAALQALLRGAEAFGGGGAAGGSGLRATVVFAKAG